MSGRCTVRSFVYNDHHENAGTNRDREISVAITTGEVMGMIDPRLEGPRVGIGYVLGRAYWGNGYMPEAMRIVIDWAFQQPTIYRVYATTDVENVASQRVLEKAGMQCEGILRKYIIHPNISEIPRDSYMYAIVK